MIRIMVGVPTAEIGRRVDFYDYLGVLQCPTGTMRLSVHGQSVAQNRNIIVRQALDNGCSHVLFIDDDTAFKPDSLVKLISHNVDIVTGIQLMRNYPHLPLIYDKILPDGNASIHYLTDDDKGLIPIEASGLGFCLIKCKVFSKLEEPFFRLGEVVKDMLGEDFDFFKRVKEIGLQPSYCDLNVPIGHMSSTIVWANNVKGQWMTTYGTNGSDVVTFPTVKLCEPSIVS